MLLAAFDESKFGPMPEVEINPAETELSGFVDHHIRARAASALESLWRG